MNVPKSVVLIASVISLWLMTGCMTEAASAQPQQEPYALIYNGPVSDGDSTKAIADVVKQVGLPVRYLSNIEALPAELDHARVFIVSCTEDDVEPLLNGFTADARSALKTYLQNGGRYLGICGGAFVASTGWSEEEGFVPALGLVPATSDDYDGDFSARIFPISWLGEERQMYYQAGPQFTPVPSPEQVKVIAHFQNHQIAALISSYGKGKVAVSGPHPVAPESWKENAVDGDKMESNIHLAAGLVNELLSEEPVTHSK